MQNLQLQPPGCLTHLPAQWLGVATSPAPHFVRESCPAASPRNSFKCRSKALQAAADSPACPRQRRRLCPTEHGRQHDHWHIHAAAGDAANAWNSSDSDARMVSMTVMCMYRITVHLSSWFRHATDDIVLCTHSLGWASLASARLAQLAFQ